MRKEQFEVIEEGRLAPELNRTVYEIKMTRILDFIGKP